MTEEEQYQVAIDVVDDYTAAMEEEAQDEQPIDEEIDDKQNADEETSKSNGVNGGDSVFSSDVMSSNSSRFDMDESSDLEDLLQSGHLKKGIIGLLERLPLFVKLFMMLIVALVGIAGVSAALVGIESKNIWAKKQLQNKNLGTLITASLINELQKERSLSQVYFAQNTSLGIESLEEQWMVTDSEVSKFQSFARGNGWASDSNVVSFLQYMNLLESTRKGIRDRTVSDRAIEKFYTQNAVVLANFILKLADADVKRFMALNIFVLMKVNAELYRGYGFDAFDAGTFGNIDNYKKFTECVSFEENYLAMLNSLAGESFMATFLDNIKDLQVSYSNTVQVAINTPYDLSSVNKQLWSDTISKKMQHMYTAETWLSKNIENHLKESVGKAASSVAAVTTLTCFLFICAVCFAWIFSKAITGPWRRMIAVQEVTIKKFVPKGFLRLLKCYKLADITLGAHAERDLTVMFSDIRDFSSMRQTMSASQIFTYLNNYLAAVGPIIRKNGGYIDKFLGDGILACFPTVAGGLKASVEMQETINLLNREKFAKEELNVGVGIHCGKVMVGAIGENDRMEGTLISDVVNLTNKLEVLTKVFKSRIITTHDMLKRLSTRKDVHYRPLGFAKINGRPLKIYELLNKEDTYKMSSLKTFKEAVELMSLHQYDKALSIFDDIAVKYPEDYAARKVRESCAKYSKDTHELLKSMTAPDALNSTQLRTSFAAFMELERSQENYFCWCQIEEYKSYATDQQRIDKLKSIHTDYLTPSSKYMVNTSDGSKKAIIDALEDYNSKQAAPSMYLFNKLQTELEILMGDTFTRFKRSDTFRTSFSKTLSIPLVYTMDE